MNDRYRYEFHIRCVCYIGLGNNGGNTPSRPQSCPGGDTEETLDYAYRVVKQPSCGYKTLSLLPHDKHEDLVILSKLPQLQ